VSAPSFAFNATAALSRAREKYGDNLSATTATLRRNATQSRNVAIVATPRAPMETGAEADMIERAGLCVDGFPAIYLDAWVRLNCQKPMRVSEADWRRALDDGRHFFDTWGWVCRSGWEWPPDELFEAPCVDSGGGLIWRLQGRTVVSYGPDYVRMNNDSVILREDVGRQNSCAKAASDLREPAVSLSGPGPPHVGFEEWREGEP
jgi:hypothetical protein